jgi:hypothetical protein
LTGYRATLAQTTRRTGETRTARVIFDRYLERLEQRAAYVTNALQTGKFDFTGHDDYSFDREHAPRPANLAVAQALWMQQLRAEYLQEKLADKKPVEIVKTLADRYTQLVQNMKELNQDDVLDIYLNALAHVYDPHSDYLGQEQMESFAIAMNLSLYGIGATLHSDDGYCTISDLVPGGPAARSGLLKPGDRIVTVAQAGKNPVDVVNMPLSHAVELIRGPKGSVDRDGTYPCGLCDSARTTNRSGLKRTVNSTIQIFFLTTTINPPYYETKQTHTRGARRSNGSGSRNLGRQRPKESSLPSRVKPVGSCDQKKI